MSLLSRFTIRTKLASMVVLSAAAVCAVVAVSASFSQSRMLQDRTAQLRAAVEMVIGTAQSLQNEVAAGKITRDEAEIQFRQRAGAMTFDKGQGYAAAYRTVDTGVMMNAANPKLEGKITGAKDSNGVMIARAIIDAATSHPEGGTCYYLYPRPGQTVPLQKMVFARLFEP